MSGRLLCLEEAVAFRRELKARGRLLVFTNGCFDLLHAGHVRYLNGARGLGDGLLVGLNDDASVRRLKGPGRPVVPEGERAEVLCALQAVDAVVLFSEDTPLRLVEALLPDILVKGADWPLAAVVGRREVEAAGGRVLTLPLLEGRSTTGLLERIGGRRT
ncbi:MAG: D-glycero-beta-D-manno-heptose 1-phosphate adenylyltransferase [Acidobacteriota bacterium]